MVKVQNVGSVVGWIISLVWIVFLVVIITNYAHKSAFVRLIHTILLPFHDVDIKLCKYIGIAFCAVNVFATQAWRHGIQNNKKHFTLWSMIWFSLILGFLLICILTIEIGKNLQEDHPELIVILIVSIVFFGHLYIIAYASFKSIEVHRTPIIELQSDSSYSIPFRSLHESNSVQTTVLSDYGYRSDDGDVAAPMFCVSPASSAPPTDDGFELNHQIKSVKSETPTDGHRFNRVHSDDVRHYEPYQRIELSDCRISMDCNQPQKPNPYSDHSHDSSHNKQDHTHT
ncbi:uncharacterized protein LOC129573294 [Sitodiplosis mosellana]|uniref:uncharacterized protein LOC129573294 n=1 Tax=Sitodiplosis mosellana TaxID=263140 RepID=UPI0024449066|nr:uncharacterized protein LOC129573294 [Sitodiplosis mosellana]